MNWGTWGANYSKQEMCQLISESFDSGINSFDHADIYGGYTTEESFGDAFIDHFCATRDREEDLYRNQVDEWQLKRYFEII